MIDPPGDDGIVQVTVAPSSFVETLGADGVPGFNKLGFGVGVIVGVGEGVGVGVGVGVTVGIGVGVGVGVGVTVGVGVGIAFAVKVSLHSDQIPRPKAFSAASFTR